ncbi:MAG TPA: tyrosine-protein phosphatase [Phenylobacterium sp.]|jgi:protein-tyrosine phosphatase|uniref:tyrosine-protein phosphatase n=1 Tax=Phenylobacterium sp. TaxID=1871053 RepID=UPI002CDCC10B|nr:tyrosine-protein phosphatase [Phenylobacterium sp.]HXA39152.1 tyrosine-protein phosphatase [Phenylobacterium sp.]
MTRHIDFDGIENFRDFGGYDTSFGRPVKRELLYRSANHAYATDADLARMAGLGLAAIVDLRRTEERRREPSKRWPGFGAAVVENDILSDHGDWVDMMKGVEVDAEWFLADGLGYYRRAPFEPRHIDLFTRYFQTLAQAEGAIVVHCAAGKDRTGLICALTHHVLGVGPDDIMADYLLTNDEARMARKMAFLGPWLRDTAGKIVDDAALRVAVSVNPAYLETAFAAIREAHGSLDGYLTDVLGVDPPLRERLQARLLA